MTPRRPPARNTVTVEIGGERHVLRSDVSPEYTRAVARHLDEAMRSLPSFPTLEPFRASILAALSITDELFQARAEIERLRVEIETRVSTTLETLASATASDDP